MFFSDLTSIIRLTHSLFPKSIKNHTRFDILTAKKAQLTKVMKHSNSQYPKFSTKTHGDLESYHQCTEKMIIFETKKCHSIFDYDQQCSWQV